MPRSVRFDLWCSIIALSWLLAGCAQSGIRQHPDFADASRAVARVAVLPPNVTHTLVALRGEGPRHPDKEGAIALTVSDVVRQGLEARGYHASTMSAGEVLGKDDSLRTAYLRLNAAYSEGRDALVDSSSPSETVLARLRELLGPSARTLAHAGGADALMMVRFEGTEKSSGKVTTEVMASALLAAMTGFVSVPDAQSGAVELTLIDGRTGDVLWRNRARAPGAASSAVQHALNEFPTRPEALRQARELQASPAADAAPAD